MFHAHSDEQIIESAWQTAQVGDSTQQRQEELCWVLLERERALNTPVVEAVLSVDALVVEVA